jgi:hypothetical protein
MLYRLAVDAAIHLQRDESRLAVAKLGLCIRELKSCMTFDVRQQDVAWTL